MEEDGETRVMDRYVVSAPVQGRLLRVSLNPGDEVQAGEVLARLSPVSAPLLDERSKAEAVARVAAAHASRRRAEASVERLKAQVSFAERDVLRRRGLAERGAVSARTLQLAELELSTLRKELDSAEFGVKVAIHELAMARAGLHPTQPVSEGEDGLWELRAPAAGRLLRVLQRSENVVPPSTPLLEVGDCRALEVVVDVLTEEAVSVRRGTPVRLLHWGGDEPLSGHVRRVEPSAFTKVSALGIEEQRVHVLVDLDSPYETWEALCDGYRVRAELQLEKREGILRVPLGAAFRHGEQWATYCVAGDRARLCPLTIGKRNDDYVEVTEGLSEGQPVILFPSDRIEDGVAIKARTRAHLITPHDASGPS